MNRANPNAEDDFLKCACQIPTELPGNLDSKWHARLPMKFSLSDKQREAGFTETGRLEKTLIDE